MTQKEFKTIIEQEIRNGDSILQRFDCLQPIVDANGIEKYEEGERQKLTNDLQKWEEYVWHILNNYFGTTHYEIVASFFISTPNEWLNFRSFGMSRMNGNLTTLKSILKRLPSMDMAQPPLGEDEVNSAPKEKPYKVFISHSSKDKDFVEALVSLLEFIGIKDTEKLFCSSISGYMIPNSENICECLREQFNDYNLFVIIVHSHNYYASPYCMNEMGVAWALRTDFCSFLVNGFGFEDMKGVINGSYTSIKVDADDAKDCLNQLKEKLTSLFELGTIEEDRWKNKRDDFLNKVNNLSNMSMPNQENGENGSEDGIFNMVYLPFLNNVFKLLDTVNYPMWMHHWACVGDASISVYRYQDIESLKELLKRFSYRYGYGELNLLLQNLRLLLKDFLLVCDQHIVLFGENEYRIDKFYKNQHVNDEIVQSYYEYVHLICDLCFELTRLLNLILEKIRWYNPTFLGGYILLTIEEEELKDVLYRKEEKSSAPYPGLKQFVEVVRFTRSKCLGEVNDINKLPIWIPNKQLDV